MKTQDFVKIGRSVHRLAESEIGRTALNVALKKLVDEIAEICSKDPQFDPALFRNACALPF